MEPKILALMIPIISTISFFTMVIFWRRYSHIEKMAMIERGMQPKDFVQKKDPYRALLTACTLIGVGVGLFVGNLVFTHFNSEPVILGFTIMLGGVGLFTGYMIQYGLKTQARKNAPQEKLEEEEYL